MKCFIKRKARKDKTPLAEPHQTLCIAEILEVILEHTDICTVLWSAQRVCRYWHDLIQNSRKIQIALFFKPSGEPHSTGQQRVSNPVIAKKIWPEYFHELRHNKSRLPDLAVFNSKIKKIYQRPGASWKRMLMHQPPIADIAVVKTHGHGYNPYLTQISIKLKGDFLRVRTLANAVKRGILVPGTDPMLLWHKPDNLKWMEIKMDWTRQCATWSYLRDSDVVFFVEACTLIEQELGKNEFERWLQSVGKTMLVRCPVRRKIWVELREGKYSLPT